MIKPGFGPTISSNWLLYLLSYPVLILIAYSNGNPVHDGHQKVSFPDLLRYSSRKVYVLSTVHKWLDPGSALHILAVGGKMECHDGALSFHRVQAQRSVWSYFTRRPLVADCPSVSSNHSLRWSRANWRGLIIDNNNAQPIRIQLWQMQLNSLLIQHSDAN